MKNSRYVRSYLKRIFFYIPDLSFIVLLEYLFIESIKYAFSPEAIGIDGLYISFTVLLFFLGVYLGSTFFLKKTYRIRMITATIGLILAFSCIYMVMAAFSGYYKIALTNTGEINALLPTVSVFFIYSVMGIIMFLRHIHPVISHYFSKRTPDIEQSLKDIFKRPDLHKS